MTVIENKPLPPEEIDPSLLIPCYVDFKPVISKTRDIQMILRADVKTFNRVQKCYLRQYNLIRAVKSRERS